MKLLEVSLKIVLLDANYIYKIRTPRKAGIRILPTNFLNFVFDLIF